MHEIEIIKRARKKRAWEKIMPEVEDAASLEQRRLILEAIERDEWAYREEVNIIYACVNIMCIVYSLGN